MPVPVFTAQYSLFNAVVKLEGNWSTSELLRLRSLHVFKHSFRPIAAQCSVVTIIFSGMRRPVYFQYEMNSAESISKMVSSFMQDWSQIVHLYCLIEDMAEYLRLGNPRN